MDQTQLAKKEAEKREVNQQATETKEPPREPKRWGVVKQTAPISVLGGDASFPALGAGKSAEELEEERKQNQALFDNPEIKSIFTVPKPRDLKPKQEEESEEYSEEYSEDEIHGVEFFGSETTSADAGSHVHVGGSSLVGGGEEEDEGEWVSSTSLSR